MKKSKMAEGFTIAAEDNVFIGFRPSGDCVAIEAFSLTAAAFPPSVIRDIAKAMKQLADAVEKSTTEKEKDEQT